MIRRVAVRCGRRHCSGGTGWRTANLSQVDLGRERIDVVDRGDLMDALAEEQRRYFVENEAPEYFDTHGVTEPKTIKEWIAKKLLDFDLSRSRAKSNSNGMRIALTTMNHANNPDWAVLFGIKDMYLEVTMWIWAIHMWLIQKRMWVVPEARLINNAMHRVYTSTAKSRIYGMYDSGIERTAIEQRMEQLFSRNLDALDEAFSPHCQYRDAILLYALYRNSPFEHREEVPMYAWYTMMQYIRLHLAVFDRIPNNEYKQGLFYFYHPLDSTLFERPDALDSISYSTDLLLGRRGASFPKDAPKAA